MESSHLIILIPTPITFSSLSHLLPFCLPNLLACLSAWLEMSQQSRCAVVFLRGMHCLGFWCAYVCGLADVRAVDQARLMLAPP